jgi:DnaK suppressor protein
VTTDQKQHIRQSLEQHLASLKGSVPEVTLGYCADENEMASRVSEAHLELVMHDRRLGGIREIEEALRRMDHPEYGACEECGEDIGAARLLARPTAKLCVDCQIERERGAAA